MNLAELIRLTAETDILNVRKGVKGEDKVLVVAVGRLQLPVIAKGRIGKGTGLE